MSEKAYAIVGIGGCISKYVTITKELAEQFRKCTDATKEMAEWFAKYESDKPSNGVFTVKLPPGASYKIVEEIVETKDHSQPLQHGGCLTGETEEGEKT